MRRAASLVMLVLIVASGIARAANGRAAGRLERWDLVMALSSGDEIEVLARNSAGPEACVVSSVDDSALTCLREGLRRDTRLVFPRGSVQEVRIWEVAPNRHIGAWVLAGVITAIAIAACVEAGPAGLLLAGLISLPLEIAATSDTWPGMGPPSMRRLPRMHWRLLYRGATP